MQMSEHSLRIPERTTPLIATLGDRIGAAVLAIACLTVLSLAAWLNPSTEGHGTHTQLGLSKCMWVAAFDRPCPTCGMTTSFSHAAEGSWFKAFKTQPMGAFLSLLTSLILWGSVTQAITGARISSMIQPILKPKLFILLAALFIGAWIYKMMTWA